MALVAYDYGSDSDAEITDEEDEASSSRVIFNEKDTPSIKAQENIDTPSNANLFSHLPQVKTTVSSNNEENDQLEDFIPTVKTLKEKKKVQITIPSLSDFDDPENEEPLHKRVKPSPKGSGLLGLLPPVQTVPKSNTMFIPNTLKKKPPVLKPASVSKAQPKKAIKLTNDSDSETEDIPIPETFDDKMWEKVCGRSKPQKSKPIEELDMTAQQPSALEYSTAPEPQKPYDGLDNIAFKELVGKTKKPIGNIKLIDINEDEIMPDKDLWMTKSLTDPDMAPKPQPDDDVDPTKKRKHHITYLAQQAKANEQELKSAWATGKNNRMMSRAKYGF